MLRLDRARQGRCLDQRDPDPAVLLALLLDLRDADGADFGGRAYMEPQPVASEIAGLRQSKLLPVIKYREHCITCFSCEIFCPEHIVDVHPSVKNRPRPW